nr:isoflavone reductase like [Quercus suber]
MAAKSKILVIGGTGYIGKYIVEASAKAGHPTFVLVRECSLSNHAKSKISHHLITLGAFFVFGDLYDHGSLVRAIKEVDVVISAIGYHDLADQDKIIAAIKEAGNVKGDLYDHGSLVRAIKEVDVVISAIGHHNLANQDKIIAAIKEAGNVKVI